MDKEKLKIVDKIQKLLALGDENKNPNEGEVQTALEFAKRLMIEHDISMSDVEIKEALIIEVDTKIKPWYGVWERTLLHVIDLTCDTTHFITRRYKRMSATFIGYEIDVAVACQLFNDLRVILKAIAKDAKKDSKNEINSFDEFHRESYLRGASYRLRERAKKIKEEKNYDLNDEKQNKYNALVVVKDKEVSKYFENAYPHMKTSRMKVNRVHLGSYGKGYEDGNKINLAKERLLHKN